MDAFIDEPGGQEIRKGKMVQDMRDDNHAVEIDGIMTGIDERLEYIHNNPVKNGLVENAWGYLYKQCEGLPIRKKGHD